MQSVACRGEELLSQQTTPNGERCVYVCLPDGRRFLKIPPSFTCVLTDVFFLSISVTVLQICRTCRIRVRVRV